MATQTPPRTIPLGQSTAPRFAAESYIGAHYSIHDGDGQYSAHPGDYWSAPDARPVGALIRNAHPFRTLTGRVVYAPRVIRNAATIGDLRRLARAAESLVR